jgi:hypothetical protein
MIVTPANTRVALAIEATVQSLAQTKFPLDPMLPADISRMCSIVESSKKRHGKIIELSLLAALQADPRYQAWQPGEFRIPSDADSLASLRAGGLATSGATLALPYTGSGRFVQIDLLVYERLIRRLAAYEIKRGHGVHDSGKIRSMERDLRCIEVVLASYGATIGLDVAITETRILFWYGTRSVKGPYSLVGAEADAHFGCPVTSWVQGATAQYAGRVLALIHGEPDPAPRQPSLALAGGSHA